VCLNAYTGCDISSAFKGQGYIKPLKTLQKTLRFAAVLSILGETWDVAEEVIDELEVFTCAIYGHA